ncbi:hypothetical protein SISSUDRAFT_1117400 [Sistotremastrum suecicum HHB10207 ss-3]|uniref:Uncharacterized protein n=1 Tax=Sistotremastrum suecicum HHB10207 ss-3 TaxID=1314776 RepID=A0A166GLH6_9AGAM|nr:hypothetical protein SISSUDRAFT_1117400 [Sistotremastrum suecicum HHB10207 ss-3]
MQVFEEAKSMQLRVPVFERRPGGPSLSDIAPFVKPYTGPLVEADEEFRTVADELAGNPDEEVDGAGKNYKMMELTLKRVAMRDLPLSQSKKLEAQRRYIMSEQTYAKLARAFLAFRGFRYPSPKPGESITAPVQLEDGIERNELMDHVLAKYARFLERYEAKRKARYEGQQQQSPAEPENSVEDREKNWAKWTEILKAQGVYPNYDDLKSRSGVMIVPDSPGNSDWPSSSQRSVERKTETSLQKGSDEGPDHSDGGEALDYDDGKHSWTSLLPDDGDTGALSDALPVERESSGRTSAAKKDDLSTNSGPSKEGKEKSSSESQKRGQRDRYADFFQLGR